jgi:hypothetical protein
MERWESRGGKSQRREEKRKKKKEERRSENRKSQRKQDAGAIHYVFSTDLWLRRVEQ